MKKTFLCLVCCLVCAAAAFANTAKTDPWVEWRRGYELFLEGDKHMRRNELEQALESYKRSRDTYQKVLDANTGWNQNLINSKINACNTQILKIERRLRAAGKKISSTSAASSKSSTAHSASSSSTSSTPSYAANDDYKRKYFNLYIEVENLRKQLRTQAQAVKNIDVLLKEKRLAEEKVAALQLNQENLRKQLAAPEKELQSIRKQLVAERLKTEQLVIARENDAKQIENQNNSIKKLNAEIAGLEQKLKNGDASRKALENNIDDLKDKLDDLNEARADLQHDLKKSEEKIASVRKDYESARKEIKKLNNWIDELNEKKGTTDKLAADIVAENRNLKNNNSALLQKLNSAESQLSATAEKLKKTQRDYSIISQNISVLDKQKKNLENELKNTRDLYVRQINAEKLTKAELDTLRKEQKKNTESLQNYVRRIAELNSALETKESATANYAGKIEALQLEITEKSKEIKKLNSIISDAKLSSAVKRLSELTEKYEKLENNNKNLQRELKNANENRDALMSEMRSLKNELAIFRTPKKTAPAKITTAAPAPNQDYQRLLTAYNDLKSKYDFLSAEIESLNKPLADVEEKSPEITSEGELAKFLLKSANDAIAANDYISAAWYYSELKKQDAKNPLYTYGYALFSTVASERVNAGKIISELPDSREKYILAGVLAILDGSNRNAANNFDKAANFASASPEVFALYRKELPKIVKMFEKTDSLKANLNTLNKLLK